MSYKLNPTTRKLDYYEKTGAAANGLPSGGTAGQILSKIDETEYNATWSDPTAGYTDADAIAAIQGDASWNASDWDTAYGWGDHAGLYLKLDQTTPQTLVNGIPLLEETRVIDSMHELVDKDYVDQAVTSLGMRFYMLSTGSGVTQPVTAEEYLNTQATPSAGAESSVTASDPADNEFIAGWISPSTGAPSKLIAGVYEWHIFAAKTGAGNKVFRIYWTLVERKSDDSEVVIATSSESNILAAKADLAVSLTVADDYTLSAGSRIVGKAYVRLVSGVSAADVVLYSEGASDSHWEIPTNKDVLDTIYASVNLSNLGTTAINTSLISDTDDTDDLGASDKKWKDLYIDGVGYIDEIDSPLIKSATGSISFDNENLSTTGTLGAGAITGTSFIIGANTLDTNEWAFLDGQDQAVKTTSSPTFATAKLTDLTDGYIPYHSSDTTGLVNSSIFTDGTKVGIGTANPTTTLDVHGTLSFANTLGDKISLYDDRIGKTGMYGFGAETSTLYYKSSRYHRWYATANADDGASDIMELDSDGSLYVKSDICVGVTSINAAAILELSSTTKGFLPPRMTTTQRNNISSPPAGLMIYNTTTNKLNFYNGTAWEAVTSS